MRKLIHSQCEGKKYSNLLTTMLPRHIAFQLKENNMNITEEYDDVTILFTDIVNFTEMTAEVQTIKTINLLNTLFSQFDDVITRFGVYKVETVFILNII